MDVKCPGCYKITTVFSHAQTVVLCVGCSTVLCQPTGGRARLTEGKKVSPNRFFKNSVSKVIVITDWPCLACKSEWRKLRYSKPRVEINRIWKIRQIVQVKAIQSFWRDFFYWLMLTLHFSLYPCLCYNKCFLIFQDALLGRNSTKLLPPPIWCVGTNTIMRKKHLVSRMRWQLDTLRNYNFLYILMIQ